MATTFEEAKKCPRCGLPGDDTSQVPAARQAVVHVIFCRNSACRWFNTSWLVQVNKDGSIPTAEHQKNEDKKFPVDARLAAQAEEIQRAMRADREAQTRKGAEIRNPR